MFPWVSDTHAQRMRFWQDDEIHFTSMGAIFNLNDRSKLKGQYTDVKSGYVTSEWPSLSPQSQYENFSRATVPLRIFFVQVESENLTRRIRLFVSTAVPEIISDCNILNTQAVTTSHCRQGIIYYFSKRWLPQNNFVILCGSENPLFL